MENENIKKIGFFSRLKIAVTKIEEYGIFIQEKTSKAVKYFFLIVLILSACMAIVETYTIMKVVNKGYEYLANELPEFNYQDGSLEFSEFVDSYDSDFDIYMIADTSDDLTDEKVDEYKDKMKSIGVLFLKDRAIYKDGIMETEYKYSELSEEYGIDTLNKESLIEKVNSIGMVGIAVTLCAIILFGLYIIQIISVFMDWLMISIFAYVSAKICRTPINFKQSFNISIYALTLPIILSILYNTAYYLFDFYTEYFRLVYLLVAYVYVVAVILIIKSDMIKQQIVVQKIEKVQKEISEEAEEKEEQEDNKENNDSEDKQEPENKEDDENDDIAGEPDGSEI